MARCRMDAGMVTSCWQIMVISLQGGGSGALARRAHKVKLGSARKGEGDHKTVSASEMRSIVMPCPGAQVGGHVVW